MVVSDIKQSINGDKVIGFTSNKEFTVSKFMDAARMSANFLEEDGKSHTKYLGLLNMFATTEHVSVPFMRDAFKNAAVLEVEPMQTITYDLAVNREASKCMVIEDTSGDSEKPGADDGLFRIILSKEFAKGDVISYDSKRGVQVAVSDQHDVEPWGEGFLHWVTLGTNNKVKYFPNDKLKPGVSFHKITNTIGEYGDGYSNITVNEGPTGSLRCEFLLGDPRGVETMMTAKAAYSNAKGLVQAAQNAIQHAQSRAEQLGGPDAMYIMSNYIGSASNGLPKLDLKTAQVGPVLEYLVLAEVAKMEAFSLSFAQAMAIPTAQGMKRLNEGLYHQQRRGNIITYPKRGGITMDHIHRASQYLYKGNTSLEIDKRRLKFKCGAMAYANMEQLFREYFTNQLTSDAVANLFGTSKRVQGDLVTGNMNEGLHIHAIKYRSLSVPGIGTIEIEHDPSMDYDPFTDRIERGFLGNGYAREAYSMVIEDVTDPQYTNVESKLNGASLVEGGSKNANIYYVQPKGGSLVFGYEQGRMATRDNQMSYVPSSFRQMARTFWATSSSAALMLDTTRYLCIELELPSIL